MNPLTATRSLELAAPDWRRRLSAFAALCKPRVNLLIVFTAMIGMVLAPVDISLLRFLAASAGIGLVACGAAAINCLVERTVDARMARTRGRPLPRGELAPAEALTLAIVLGAAGLALLHAFTTTLATWLTLATFLGYAVIYTAILKPATPMNIVIGGASGAMPPVLGWTAMTGSMAAEPLALFLIVFLWTPPHFWALAMARRDDYARAGFPMLPITHGIGLTCLHSLLYVIMLTAASFLPVTLGMAGGVYALAVAWLNALFLAQAIGLVRKYSDAASRRMFGFSIAYLSLLFAALFADRLLAPWLPRWF
ncbi:MAG TPA: heme o synthase [Rhodocyclaceae bacterium]